jgi:hypothetical protein
MGKNTGKRWQQNQKLKTDGVVETVRGFISRLILLAVALGTTDAVHAAIVDDGTEQTITTAITNPDVSRVISATAGGTATDIGAIQVTINGTNDDDEVISEDLPAFTVDTAGTVTGSKAFKTVTSIVVPAHDGLAATTAIGIGDILGIPFLLDHDTVLKTYLDDVLEGTAPTVTTSSTVLESNTIDLNSALDGSDIDVYLIVS